MQFYYAELNDLRLRIDFDYSPGTPDVMYLPNGDPGYPGDPEELCINTIMIQKKVLGENGLSVWKDTGIDLAGWLFEGYDENVLSNIAEAAYEEMEKLADEAMCERHERAYDFD